tara:strand:+ start:80 stop:193 length:114 start_codon:yes stop_codon:yes gene_type:complete
MEFNHFVPPTSPVKKGAKNSPAKEHPDENHNFESKKN